MSLFGIPDPTIWLSYVGCIVCVVVSYVWYFAKNEEAEDDE